MFADDIFLSPYDDGGETVPQLELDHPEVAVDHPSSCGEGPVWNEDERALYWLDIPNGQLFRYDVASDHNEEVYKHEEQIGGYTFQADGSILLFCSRGKVLHWRAGTVETVIDSIPAEENSRFNDVIAAPDGGVFCGTMPAGGHLSRLYRLAPDGTLTMLFDDIGQSNGMGFSPDLDILYHTDSNFHVIYALDYEAKTGAIANRRVFIRTPNDDTVPDGMTVDADGTVWSARWGGEGVYKYTPEGTLVGKVVLPVNQVSSITFGDEGLKTAFVTTAGGDERGESKGPLAGSLFRVDLQVAGRAPFRSRIGS